MIACHQVGHRDLMRRSEQSDSEACSVVSEEAFLR